LLVWGLAMSIKNLVCWKCDVSLKDYTLPIGTHDLCPQCRDDLHVCHMCRSYDTRFSSKCRKEEADYVANKERANYCHYFKPRGNAFQVKASPDDNPLDDLALLFGENSESMESTAVSTTPQDPQSELDQFFGGKGECTADVDLSADEKNRIELEKLFGNKN